MAEKNHEKVPYLRVAEFYHGKSVFMTGAAGYLGVLVLETLLELCPGIKNIYILLRERRGVSPEKRKDDLLKRVIFDKMKKNTPELLEKVQVVSGDVSLPHFGMSEEDLQKVTENTSIVFHIAANVNFKKTLKFTLQSNVMSVQYAIDICRKFKRLDAFVFTSSSYGNSNRDSVIQEKIYRLPFHSQKFLDEISNGTDESLNKLVSQCLPSWPNFYTFSKVLAENVIQDNASDLPAIIVRPSIIGSVWKRPHPGYMEETSGITALSLAVAKGFLKTLPADPNNVFNFVPGDISASTHIIAAWSVATNRSPPLHVINNASCIIMTIQYYNQVMHRALGHCGGVVPNAFRIARSFRFCTYPLGYRIIVLFEHYIPAYCFDALLKICGSKMRLVPIYKMADRAIASMKYFLTKHWDFDTENFQNLLNQLQDEDIKLFELEERFSTGEELAEQVMSSAPFFQWSTDKKSKKQRFKAATQRLYLTYLFQGLFLVGVAASLFLIFTVTSALVN